MKFLSIHKILSIALAFLVVFSTLSFTVEKHYCGDNLVDISVFSEVKKCGMEMSPNTEAIKKSCCKDEIDVVKGQNDLKLNTSDDLLPVQIVFLQSFVYSFNALFESLTKQIIPHNDYSPPNLVADIQLLDQVFTI
uniref:HYC_CC_PP family protein n=1 Tax=Winogradskyella litoriviva TaxID=1220182 RepID=UPI00293BD5D3|nr:hypothetical protein [Winogradskyella litoriviva]